MSQRPLWHIITTVYKRAPGGDAVHTTFLLVRWQANVQGESHHRH